MPLIPVARHIPRIRKKNDQMARRASPNRTCAMQLFGKLLILSVAAGITAHSTLLAEDTPEQARLREALREAINSSHPPSAAPVTQASPAALPAAASGPRAISLQDCLRAALEHNLALTIERYNPLASQHAIEAAQGDYDPTFRFSAARNSSESAGTDFDPNTGNPIPGPTRKTDRLGSGLGGLLPWGMEYDFSGDVTETVRKSGNGIFPDTSGSIGVALTQPLLRNSWTDVTRLRIQVAKIGLKTSETALRLKIIEVVTAVEITYYNLMAARENVNVREKALELANRLFEENKQRVEVGALAPLEEKQAQAQVAIARADLLSAQQTLAEQKNALKTLLTDDYLAFHSAELEPTEILAAPQQEFNLRNSWSKGLTYRPDLQQEKLNLERAGVQLKYDHNQLLPRLDVVGSFGYGSGGVAAANFGDVLEGFRNRDLPSYAYGAVLSIPLGNRSARNNHRVSKIAVQQALLAVKQIEQAILVEIDDAVTAAKASNERVDATRQAGLYAEAALEAEQKKLESGKSTSFNVLQLQRDLTDARSREISARADYNKALATLAQAEGSTLERRAIDVRVK